MSSLRKDEIDGPSTAQRGGGLNHVALSVFLSVCLSVPITLAILSLSRPPFPATVASSGPEAQVENGTFTVVAGQEGQVNFPIPYASPPNVEFTGFDPQFNKTILVETTATGFRWSNRGQDNVFNNAKVSWSSRGVLRRNEARKNANR